MKKTTFHVIASDEIIRQKHVIEGECHKVMQSVSDYYAISISDLVSQKRDGVLMKPRHIAMYFMMQISEMTLGKTASYFNRQCHATVIHGVGIISELAKESKPFKKELLIVADIINSAA